jgi:DNA-binding transcriptional ArsR family regulator
MTEDFKEIVDFIRSPVFSSSARIGILLVLLGVDRITFTDLLKSVGMSKSSLYSHLKVLEENGLIIVKDVFTLTRPRTIIQITPKGKIMIEKYLDILEKYVKRNGEE